MHLLYPANTMPQEEWLNDQTREAMIARFWKMFHEVIGDDAVITRFELMGNLLTRELSLSELSRLSHQFRTEFRRELRYDIEDGEKIFVGASS